MIQHKTLALGRWFQMSLMEQLANTGSEVGRSLKWKSNQQDALFQKAWARALELLDLTIQDPKNKSRLSELTRLREVLLDYMVDRNEYGSSASFWTSYFSGFGLAARKGQ